MNLPSKLLILMLIINLNCAIAEITSENQLPDVEVHLENLPVSPNSSKNNLIKKPIKKITHKPVATLATEPKTTKIMPQQFKQLLLCRSKHQLSPCRNKAR